MNLALRQAALEAYGYWYEGGTSVGYFHTPKCPRPANPGHQDCDHAGHFHIDDMPAVEVDPGISEPLFLEWCEKNNTNFEVRDYFNDPMQTKRYFIVTLWMSTGLLVAQRGETISEAIAKAVIEAAKGLTK